MNSFIKISVFFSVLCMTSSCTKLSDPLTLTIDKVIKIGFENDSILQADNHDQTTIIAALDKDNVGINQEVTFTTEQGHFIGGGSSDSKSIKVRADGYKAKAILVGDSKVNPKVNISATVGKYTVYSSASFLRSYPDLILTTFSGNLINTTLNSRITLTIKMKKNDVGDPSDETQVDFKIINISGSPKVFVQSLFWSKANSQNSTEVSSITSDTGTIKITPYVLNGNDSILGKDAALIRIRN